MPLSCAQSRSAENKIVNGEITTVAILNTS